MYSNLLFILGNFFKICIANLALGFDRPWHKLNGWLAHIVKPWFKATVYKVMKFSSPCWMYETLLSSLPLWSNYTKSEKQSAVKGCCEYPPPQSRCWGWQPQEVTSLHLGYLLILQTVISLPTLPLLVALHLILEKSSSWGMVPFQWTSSFKFWKKLVTLILPVNNIPTFSLYFVWESCL